jgi:hypothetical protein
VKTGVDFGAEATGPGCGAGPQAERQEAARSASPAAPVLNLLVIRKSFKTNRIFNTSHNRRSRFAAAYVRLISGEAFGRPRNTVLALPVGPQETMPANLRDFD